MHSSSTSFGGRAYKIYSNIVVAYQQTWCKLNIALDNSEEPDQPASEEAGWSGSLLFAVQ